MQEQSPYSRNGYRELEFVLDRYVIGSIPDGKLQDKRHCYRYLHCFISIYFNVNDELEAVACGRRLLDVRVIYMRMCGVCLRAISGSKSQSINIYLYSSLKGSNKN